MEKFAVIVAGGSGKRMGSILPKQFLMLQGQPVLSHTINKFFSAYPNMQLIIVVPDEYIEEGRRIAAKSVSPENVKIVQGGATRFESVGNGLKHVPEGVVVFVHDAVRCLVSEALIRDCYEHTITHGSAVPAVPVIDSVRIVEGDEHHVIDRDKLRIIQTPQTFFSGPLKQAFQQPHQDTFTDEATVMESTGFKVTLVQGEYTNLKITTQFDLLLAERILEYNK
jgi:2-C-methyl-D-erythritol 4-phosphate cytidylyltransferase